VILEKDRDLEGEATAFCFGLFPFSWAFDSPNRPFRNPREFFCSRTVFLFLQAFVCLLMMREGVPLSWVWPSSQAIPESPGNFLDTKSILTLLKESEVNDVKEQEKAPEELGTEILG
jgi:hypothetical protein